MPDDAFDDPRLVALYDPAERKRPDLVHYEAIVDEFGAQSVLDLGCGTGTFASSLASQGIDVVGVDPARASLDVAESKPHADTIRWLHGDATTLPPLQVDMVTMTGNVAQVFLTNEEWLATLTAVHAALRPGGHVVFEVRDPAFRGWEEWTSDQSTGTFRTEAEGTIVSWVDLIDVSLPLVTFEWTFCFENEGDELTSRSTLRFRERSEIEAQLVQVGFRIVDVRDAPDRPNKEFVFIAQR